MIFQIPNNKILDSCSEIFDNLIYAKTDQAILNTVKAFPGNTDITEVLAKVSIIITLYATPIFDIVRMAKHISGIEQLDNLLRIGDKAAVDHIRTGSGIRSKTGTEMKFYSFATKYCAFHNPSEYPIYDNMVVCLLMYLNKHFINKPDHQFEKLYRNDLMDYCFYCEIIDKYMHEFGFAGRSYKDFDKGLWIFAKHHFLKYSPTPIKSENDLSLMNEVETVIEKYA